MRRSRGQGKALKASIHVLTQTSVILLSYTLYHFHLQFTVCGVVPAGLFECATPQARRGTRAPHALSSRAMPMASSWPARTQSSSQRSAVQRCAGDIAVFPRVCVCVCMSCLVVSVIPWISHVWRDASRVVSATRANSDTHRRHVVCSGCECLLSV